VRFAKADPASLPDRMVFGGPGGGHGMAVERRMMVDGEGELTPVMALGVILDSDPEEPATVKVGMVLPGAATELQEGDVLRRIDGAEVESATWVEQAVDRAEVGARLELVVLRGEEELTLRQAKSDAQGTVRIRKQ
jgi:S1-C subfamily serine protease